MSNHIENTGLAKLEERLGEELSLLELPAKSWVPERTFNGNNLLDVAIIGGGMAGLTVATALKHLGVQATLFDRAPAGFEGPWATTARMETLRSPKQLTGPALGIPSLTFRAWFEAQFGRQEWDVLDKIPRLQWMDYLRWYRKVMEVDVRNEHEVQKVQLHPEGHLILTIKHRERVEEVYARRLILATGRDGLGGPSVPDFAAEIPEHLWAHSADVFDYTTLQGKRVGVIGAGASAMDCAGTALEAGAQSVELIIRRDDIPRINKGKGAGSPGLVHGYADLADEWKWRIRHYINVQQVPPPKGSTLRVSQHPNAFFNLGAAVDHVSMEGEEIHVHTPKGVFKLDFLFFATGFKIDWAMRPEYASFSHLVRTWSERYQAPVDEVDAELAACPDLGPNFEFQAKAGVDAPALSNIYCFSYPAVASHGTVSGDIPAISDGATAIAQGIVSSLFKEDIEHHYAELIAFAEPELDGDEWVPALPPQSRGV